MTSTPSPDAAAGHLPSTRGSDPLESAAWQSAGIAAAVATIAALHWNNDGLWYQGDAPRHAANGLFIWDWLVSLPANPLSFALSYYARYPIIAPVAYPPLFYVLEGLAFGLWGPSPWLAKTLVLAFTATLATYTMLWGRRWISPMAGWAGLAVVLLPGLILYSNAVLLNVPGTALSVAALYHLHRWLDAPNRRQATLFVVLAAASVITYYPAAIILPMGMVWTLASDRRSMSRPLWVIPLLVLVASLLASAFMPVHFLRQAPSPARLLDGTYWLYYLREIARVTGWPWLALGAAGAVATLPRASRHRREVALLASGCGTALVCLVALPAMSDRYALVVGPLIVLCGFAAIVAVIDRVSTRQRPARLVALLVVMGVSVRAAAVTQVPNVTGFDRVADYLRRHGPRDTVLYSGAHDGVFGFYLLADDREFERRLVLSNKLLYRYRQDARFVWLEEPRVTSPDDVAPLMQRECGCQWVAVEIGGEAHLPRSEQLLRQALLTASFERVESFPVGARRVSRIDLYRFALSGPAPERVDLAFPSFSGRVFEQVKPVGRR